MPPTRLAQVYGSEVTFTAHILPAVTTQPVTDIGTTTATGNGNITSLGVPAPTQYGVVWDTAMDPTVALATKTEQGVPAGTGAFTSAITGLAQETLYHVRAYATNAAGTVYGEDVTFTTSSTATSTTPATNAGTGSDNAASMEQLPGWFQATSRRMTPIMQSRHSAVCSHFALSWKARTMALPSLPMPSSMALWSPSAVTKTPPVPAPMSMTAWSA